MQWRYHIDVSLEEGKIRELTGKELVEDRVGLIIKSLVNLCEIISSFLFFVLCYVKELRVLYMHQKYMMAFSSNSKLVFIIILKIAGFYISFSSIFKIIFHNFLCCLQNSCFENFIQGWMPPAMCLIMVGLNSIFNEVN